MITVSLSEYFLYLRNMYLPLQLPLLIATITQFLLFFVWNKVGIKKLPQYAVKFTVAFAKTVFACAFIILIADRFRTGTVAVMLLAIYIFMRFLKYLNLIGVVHKRFRLWFFLMSLYIVCKYTLHAILTNEWFLMVQSRLFLIIQFIVGLFLGETAMLK